MQGANLSNSECGKLDTSSSTLNSNNNRIEPLENGNSATDLQLPKPGTTADNSSDDDTKSEKPPVISTPEKTKELTKIESNNNDDKADNKVIRTNSNNADPNEKCDTCGQFLNNSDIIYYEGHPQDAVEEFIALTNEKLVLASGK